MQDNQQEFAQLVKLQREQFQRQVRLMEQRHQALLRQQVQERRASGWRWLLGAVRAVIATHVRQVSDGVIHQRSWPWTPASEEVGYPPASAVIDVLYTVSATGEIEQTELHAAKEAYIE